MAIFDKKESKEKKAAVETVEGSAPAIRVPTALIQPRISEKAGKMVSMNKYTFKVLKATNKVEVKKAVESFYKVKVIQVNMVNNQGKARTFGRTSGRTQAFKKAIVTLKKGDKIEGLTDVV